MPSNIFFKKKGPFTIRELFPKKSFKVNIKIVDIKNLNNAKINDLTFFDSTRYADFAKSTKASYCVTTKKLQSHLNTNCKPVLVNNVLFSLASITKKFYPSADIDYPDTTLNIPKKSKYPGVRFGKNVLVGINVKIGKKTPQACKSAKPAAPSRALPPQTPPCRQERVRSLIWRSA